MAETIERSQELMSHDLQKRSPARRNVEHVAGSGIYPASGAGAPGGAELRGQSELAHPEERRAYKLLPGAQLRTFPLLVGRSLLGGFFLYNGINHFQHRQMLTEYARAKHVPAPELAVAGSGAMLAAAGLSLIAGVRPGIGSSLAAAFLLGVSPTMHAFWRETDPQQRMNEMVNFTKNIALIGGAMFAAAVPRPWPYAPRSA